MVYILVHTYIHKEYLYSAYHPTVRVSMHCGRWTNSLKVTNDSPGCRRPGGRSFQARGPAAEKLLSPNLLWVRGRTNVRMSLELDRSGRRSALDSRRQCCRWGTQARLHPVTGERVLLPYIPLADGLGNQCSRRSTGMMGHIWLYRQYDGTMVTHRTYGSSVFVLLSQQNLFSTLMLPTFATVGDKLGRCVVGISCRSSLKVDVVQVQGVPKE